MIYIIEKQKIFYQKIIRNLLHLSTSKLYTRNLVMTKAMKNALPTTPHVLIVDGSKRPGTQIGGWAVVYLYNGILKNQWSGGISHCKESQDAEIQAIFEAIQYAQSLGEPLTIVSDCMPAIQRITLGQDIPWGLIQTTQKWLENPNNTIKWVAGETFPVQKLAHHLANGARLIKEMENNTKSCTKPIKYHKKSTRKIEREERMENLSFG